MGEIITAGMRLTSKGRYGVRALFQLAYHHEGRAAQMREIAEQAAVPVRFLEQIFHELKRAGLLTAKRGPGGGYRLSRAPSEISLGDVVRALEGSAFALTRSEERDARRDPIAHAMVGLAHEIERCFDKVTLADLCRSGERLGVARRKAARAKEEDPDYAI